jgi:nucleoside-diphosphate-sugar epimerase
MSQRIGLLGCGWLGLALAKRFLDSGCTVHGSTTQKDTFSVFESVGILPFLISVSNESLEADDFSFFDVDTLIITLPFRRTFSSASIYCDYIKQVLKHVSERTTRIVFTSSTAVYSNTNDWVDEETVLSLDTERQAVLHEVEQLVLSSSVRHSYVFRLGGLYGPGRELAQFLAGKTVTKPCRTPVNLIHQSDAVSIIYECCVKPPKSGVYNAVSDEHPTREAVYGDSAEFTDFSDKPFKLVSNKKVSDVLGFSFRYPNPLRGDV